MVIGAATNNSYGYRGGGEKFLVHRDDVAAQPNIFRPIAVEATAPSKAPLPPPPPKPVSPVAVEKASEVIGLASQSLEQATVLEVETEDTEEFDLTLVPGITPEIAGSLQAKGVQSLADLIKLGASGLTQIKGIGPSRADAIITYATNALTEQEKK